MNDRYLKDEDREDLPEFSQAQPAWQLAMFSVLSLGIYEFVWFYKTWRDFRDYKDPNISPGFSTFLLLVPVINVYILYKFFSGIRFYLKEAQVYATPYAIANIFRLKESSPGAGGQESFAWPAALTFIWFVFKLIGMGKGVWAGFTVLTVVPLAIVQTFLNVYWLKAMPRLPVRSRLTRGQWIFLILLLILWFFFFVGINQRAQYDVYNY